MKRKKHLIILLAMLLVLIAVWLVFGKHKTVSVNDIATAFNGQSESGIGKHPVKSDFSTKLDVSVQNKIVTTTDKAGQQQDSLTSEMDADYKAYILDPDTPIVESLGGLIELANEGNGDALFNLLMASESCRYFKTDEYCPGTGLEERSGTPATFYAALKDAASKGSLTAMTILGMYVPSPFKDKQDLLQNRFLRALMAEVVTEHNVAVREYLEIAAQRGHLPALLIAAEYFASDPAVDPDREKAAFYLLAWQELVILDQPAEVIPAHLRANILDPMSADAYARVKAMAENFAAQFKP